MRSASGFKDYFSDHASGYARYRPHYPSALFDFLAQLTDRHTLAWDCATGNGQVAVALAKHYTRVVATDASGAQIEAAIAHASVDYRVAPAEHSGLETSSVDLVTVGQALHWFDIERFTAEAERVLVSDGILAAWCYELCEIDDACDRVVHRLYADIVDEFWPPERRMIERRYEGLQLPGAPVELPDLTMTTSWQAGDMLGYLRTWSACQRYEREHDADPVAIIEADLEAAWGRDAREVRWPLTLRASRLH